MEENWVFKQNLNPCLPALQSGVLSTTAQEQREQIDRGHIPARDIFPVGYLHLSIIVSKAFLVQTVSVLLIIKQQTQFEAKLEQEKEKHASAEAEIEEVRT